MNTDPEAGTVSSHLSSIDNHQSSIINALGRWDAEEMQPPMNADKR